MCCIRSSYAGTEAEGLRELRAEAKAAALAAQGAAAPEGASQPQALDQLPACVRRYLDLSSASSSVQYMLVTSRQVGEFKFDPKGPWQPMAATQCASPAAPAFFWTTRCRFKPLIGIRGFDCLLGGKGSIDWRLWGWLPALAASGLLLDQSMLVRWLAETPGFPRAMLPSPILRWEAVQGAENEARAVVRHQGVSASGVFGFDEEGRVASFRTEDHVRPLPAGGSERRTWVIRYSDHQLLEVDGLDGRDGSTLYVPTRSEAAWVEPDGSDFAYVRFSLQGVAAQ